MAVSGLILGIIGTLIGGALWILLIVTPDPTVIPGAQVSESERATLERMDVLGADEQIDMFYASGFFSIEEGGVILTDRRLIVYGTGRRDQIPLHEIASITYTASPTWFDDGMFLAETDDGQVNFAVAGQDSGDDRFYDALRQAVTKAREREGKPPPTVNKN